jgi:predicted ATPase
VEEIRLQNYRALDNARLGLSDLTLLVGRNGAGKSSVLDAVEFIREAVTDSLPNALDRRDGFAGVFRKGAPAGEPLGVAVVMSATVGSRAVRMLYGFKLDAEGRIEEALRVTPNTSLGFRRREGEFESNSRITPAIPPQRLVLPLVAVEELWQIAWSALAAMRAYEIAPHSVEASNKIESATNLVRDGANAGDVLAEVRGREDAYGAVLGSLRAVTTGIVDIQARPSAGRRLITFSQRVQDAQNALTAQQVSRGTLRALGVLLALYQSPEPSLVLIDEVEDSIHPMGLEALLEAMEDVAERFPVVATTHSPEVLATRYARPERLRILQWKDGVSRIYPLSEGTRESVDALTTVGDLLRMNALWPSDAPDRFEGDLLELEP